jgi:hypothetical protein
LRARENTEWRNERHERFARLRAILTPKLQAARDAGFETMAAGNVARLDRHPDIRARVAALSKMDEEIVRMKRERIEVRLMKAMEADILRDFALVETCWSTASKRRRLSASTGRSFGRVTALSSSPSSRSIPRAGI